MKNIKDIWRRIAAEWELAALATVVVALLLLGLVWLLSDRSGGLPALPKRGLPAVKRLVNYEAAYIVFDGEEVPVLGERPAFASGIDFTPAPPPKPPKPPKPPTATTLDPEPKPKPKPTPEPEPDPEPPPVAPQFYEIVYEGYHLSDGGVRMAVFNNRSTGQRFVIPQGRKLRGLLVTEAAPNKVTFLSPGGKERVVEVNVPMRFPAD